jgi:salicylate hydroxylase
LKRWNLDKQLEPLVTNPKLFTVHTYSNGALLGKCENYGEKMFQLYGSHFWDVHRADLQIALYNRAKELGVNFRFGVWVEGHDFKEPAVSLSTGEKISGDLIIAADGEALSSLGYFCARLTLLGLHSKTRSSFLGRPSPPIPTGDLAYRILLKVEDITDPEILEFAKTPRVCLWVGPDCHVMYYPLKNNTLLNIVLLVPDNLPEAVAKAPGDLAEMHEIFTKWDPR